MSKFIWTEEAVLLVEDMRNTGHKWQEILKVLKTEEFEGADQLTNKKLRSSWTYHRPTECDATDEEVTADATAKLHNTRVAASKERATVKAMANYVNAQATIADAVQEAVANLKGFKGLKLLDVNKKKSATAKPAVLEVMFSDYQIGKLTEHYNTPKAEEGIAIYGAAIWDKLQDPKYKYEKIIFASIGDIVEDHMKHGVGSAVSTDTGLSEQMANAIEHIWKYLLEPMGRSGVPVEVMGIAGNHGASVHKGMDSFKAGRFCYDYAIYTALRLLTEVAGYDNVKFILPEGCFAITDIFNRKALYEHGYTNNCTEASMDKKLKDRSNQLRTYIDYFRCGDMHHTCAFDNGRLMMNGAFFGTDTQGYEYSGILGFSAIPAQTMIVHTPSNHPCRNTVAEIINVQVAS